MSGTRSTTIESITQTSAIVHALNPLAGTTFAISLNANEFDDDNTTSKVTSRSIASDGTMRDVFLPLKDLKLDTQYKVYADYVIGKGNRPSLLSFVKKEVKYIHLGGGLNVFAVSFDGKEWTGGGSGLLTGRAKCGIWDGRSWRIGGFGAGETIMSSSNGVDWLGYVTPLTIMNGISYKAITSTYVGVGSGIDTNIVYSSNGLEWKPSNPPITVGLNDVATDGYMFVAVGSEILYSFNGSVWRPTLIKNTNLNRIYFNGFYWIAIGPSMLAYSTNGIIWNTKDNKYGIQSIAWNGVTWLGVNSVSTSRKAYTSPDGINWSDPSYDNMRYSEIVWSDENILVGGIPETSVTNSMVGYSLTNGQNWSDTERNLLSSTDRVLYKRILPHIPGKIVTSETTCDAISRMMDTPASVQFLLALKDFKFKKYTPQPNEVNQIGRFNSKYTSDNPPETFVNSNTPNTINKPRTPIMLHTYKGILTSDKAGIVFQNDIDGKGILLKSNIDYGFATISGTNSDNSSTNGIQLILNGSVIQTLYQKGDAFFNEDNTIHTFNANEYKCIEQLFPNKLVDRLNGLNSDPSIETTYKTTKSQFQSDCKTIYNIATSSTNPDLTGVLSRVGRERRGNIAYVDATSTYLSVKYKTYLDQINYTNISNDVVIYSHPFPSDNIPLTQSKLSIVSSQGFVYYFYNENIVAIVRQSITKRNAKYNLFLNEKIVKYSLLLPPIGSTILGSGIYYVFDSTGAIYQKTLFNPSSDDLNLLASQGSLITADSLYAFYNGAPLYISEVADTFNGQYIVTTNGLGSGFFNGINKGQTPINYASDTTSILKFYQVGLSSTHSNIKRSDWLSINSLGYSSCLETKIFANTFLLNGLLTSERLESLFQCVFVKAYSTTNTEVVAYQQQSETIDFSTNSQMYVSTILYLWLSTLDSLILNETNANACNLYTAVNTFSDEIQGEIDNIRKLYNDTIDIIGHDIEASITITKSNYENTSRNITSVFCSQYGPLVTDPTLGANYFIRTAPDIDYLNNRMFTLDGNLFITFNQSTPFGIIENIPPLLNAFSDMISLYFEICDPITNLTFYGIQQNYFAFRRNLLNENNQQIQNIIRTTRVVENIKVFATNTVNYLINLNPPGTTPYYTPEILYGDKLRTLKTYIVDRYNLVSTVITGSISSILKTTTSRLIPLIEDTTKDTNSLSAKISEIDRTLSIILPVEKKLWPLGATSAALVDPYYLVFTPLTNSQLISNEYYLKARSLGDVLTVEKGCSDYLAYRSNFNAYKTIIRNTYQNDPSNMDRFNEGQNLIDTYLQRAPFFFGSETVDEVNKIRAANRSSLITPETKVNTQLLQVFSNDVFQWNEAYDRTSSENAIFIGQIRGEEIVYFYESPLTFLYNGYKVTLRNTTEIKKSELLVEMAYAINNLRAVLIRSKRDNPAIQQPKLPGGLDDSRTIYFTSYNPDGSINYIGRETAVPNLKITRILSGVDSETIYSPKTNLFHLVFNWFDIKTDNQLLSTSKEADLDDTIQFTDSYSSRFLGFGEDIVDTSGNPIVHKITNGVLFISTNPFLMESHKADFYHHAFSALNNRVKYLNEIDILISECITTFETQFITAVEVWFTTYDPPVINPPVDPPPCSDLLDKYDEYLNTYLPAFKAAYNGYKADTANGTITTNSRYDYIRAATSAYNSILNIKDYLDKSVAGYQNFHETVSYITKAIQSYSDSEQRRFKMVNNYINGGAPPIVTYNGLGEDFIMSVVPVPTYMSSTINILAANTSYTGPTGSNISLYEITDTGTTGPTGSTYITYNKYVTVVTTITGSTPPDGYAGPTGYTLPLASTGSTGDIGLRFWTQIRGGNIYDYPEFRINWPYYDLDIVSYNGNVYQCNGLVITGKNPIDYPEYWDEITPTSFTSDHISTKYDDSGRYNHYSTVAYAPTGSSTYKIYRCTYNIDISDLEEYTQGTSSVRFNRNLGFTNLKTSIANYNASEALIDRITAIKYKSSSPGIIANSVSFTATYGDNNWNRQTETYNSYTCNGDARYETEYPGICEYIEKNIIQKYDYVPASFTYYISSIVTATQLTNNYGYTGDNSSKTYTIQIKTNKNPNPIKVLDENANPYEYPTSDPNYNDFRQHVDTIYNTPINYKENTLLGLEVGIIKAPYSDPQNPVINMESKIKNKLFKLLFTECIQCDTNMDSSNYKSVKRYSDEVVNNTTLYEDTIGRDKFFKPHVRAQLLNSYFDYVGDTTGIKLTDYPDWYEKLGSFPVDMYFPPNYGQTGYTGPSGTQGPSFHFKFEKCANSLFKNGAGNSLGYGAASSSEKWVAVGYNVSSGGGYTGPSTVFSTQGALWLECNGANFNSGYGKHVKCGGTGSTWLAVGTNRDNFGSPTGPSIIRSQDGINWVNTTGANFDRGYGNMVEYGGTGVGWVAVGKNNGGPSVLYSKDGMHWTGTVGANFDTNEGKAVVYGGINFGWIAVGGNIGPTGPSIIYSDDGMHWTGTVGANFNRGSGIALTIGPSGCVAVGENAGLTGDSVIFSEDGLYWRETSGANNNIRFGTSVVYADGRYVAIGTPNGVTGSSIIYSENGIDWEGARGDNFGTNSGNALTYGDLGWVAVGEPSDSSHPSIVFSYDGSVWAGATGSSFDIKYANAIGYNNSVWVSLGGQRGPTGSSIIYSIPIGASGISVTSERTVSGYSPATSEYVWKSTTTDFYDDKTKYKVDDRVVVQYSNDGGITYSFEEYICHHVPLINYIVGVSPETDISNVYWKSLGNQTVVHGWSPIPYTLSAPIRTGQYAQLVAANDGSPELQGYPPAIICKVKSVTPLKATPTVADLANGYWVIEPVISYAQGDIVVYDDGNSLQMYAAYINTSELVDIHDTLHWIPLGPATNFDIYKSSKKYKKGDTTHILNATTNAYTTYQCINVDVPEFGAYDTALYHEADYVIDVSPEEDVDKLIWAKNDLELKYTLDVPIAPIPKSATSTRFDVAYDTATVMQNVFIRNAITYRYLFKNAPIVASAVGASGYYYNSRSGYRFRINEPSTEDPISENDVFFTFTPVTDITKRPANLPSFINMNQNNHVMFTGYLHNIVDINQDNYKNYSYGDACITPLGIMFFYYEDYSDPVNPVISWTSPHYINRQTVTIDSSRNLIRTTFNYKDWYKPYAVDRLIRATASYANLTNRDEIDGIVGPEVYLPDYKYLKNQIISYPNYNTYTGYVGESFPSPTGTTIPVVPPPSGGDISQSIAVIRPESVRSPYIPPNIPTIDITKLTLIGFTGYEQYPPVTPVALFPDISIQIPLNDSQYIPPIRSTKSELKLNDAIYCFVDDSVYVWDGAHWVFGFILESYTLTNAPARFGHYHYYSGTYALNGVPRYGLGVKSDMWRASGMLRKMRYEYALNIEHPKFEVESKICLLDEIFRDRSAWDIRYFRYKDCNAASLWEFLRTAYKNIVPRTTTVLLKNALKVLTDAITAEVNRKLLDINLNRLVINYYKNYFFTRDFIVDIVTSDTNKYLLINMDTTHPVDLGFGSRNTTLTPSDLRDYMLVGIRKSIRNRLLPKTDINLTSKDYNWITLALESSRSLPTGESANLLRALGDEIEASGPGQIFQASMARFQDEISKLEHTILQDIQYCKDLIGYDELDKLLVTQQLGTIRYGQGGICDRNWLSTCNVDGVVIPIRGIDLNYSFIPTWNPPTSTEAPDTTKFGDILTGLILSLQSNYNDFFEKSMAYYTPANAVAIQTILGATQVIEILNMFNAVGNSDYRNRVFTPRPSTAGDKAAGFFGALGVSILGLLGASGMQNGNQVRHQSHTKYRALWDNTKAVGTLFSSKARPPIPTPSVSELMRAIRPNNGEIIRAAADTKALQDAVDTTTSSVWEWVGEGDGGGGGLEGTNTRRISDMAFNFMLALIKSKERLETTIEYSTRTVYPEPTRVVIPGIPPQITLPDPPPVPPDSDVPTPRPPPPPRPDPTPEPRITFRPTQVRPAVRAPIERPALPPPRVPLVRQPSAAFSYPPMPPPNTTPAAEAVLPPARRFVGRETPQNYNFRPVAKATSVAASPVTGGVVPLGMSSAERMAQQRAEASARSAEKRRALEYAATVARYEADKAAAENAYYRAKASRRAAEAAEVARIKNEIAEADRANYAASEAARLAEMEASAARIASNEAATAARNAQAARNAAANTASAGEVAAASTSSRNLSRPDPQSLTTALVAVTPGTRPSSSRTLGDPFVVVPGTAPTFTLEQGPPYEVLTATATTRRVRRVKDIKLSMLSIFSWGRPTPLTSGPPSTSSPTPRSISQTADLTKGHWKLVSSISGPTTPIVELTANGPNSSPNTLKLKTATGEEVSLTAQDLSGPTTAVAEAVDNARKKASILSKANRARALSVAGHALGIISVGVSAIQASFTPYGLHDFFVNPSSYAAILALSKKTGVFSSLISAGVMIAGIFSNDLDTAMSSLTQGVIMMVSIGLNAFIPGLGEVLQFMCALVDNLQHGEWLSDTQY
jgi:hypothetical protein